MRILLLAHSFNSLTQRLWVELRAAGHAVSVELDIADSVTEDAVARWQPDLVIAPFLKRRIPENVWSRRPCWVVHPGPPGDRGPSALDWAVMDQEAQWGVTVLQANGEFDAGPVCANAGFAMRGASKGEIYRREVIEAAVQAVRDALAKFSVGAVHVEPLEARAPKLRPLLKAEARSVHWRQHDAATALRLIRSADGHPGAPSVIDGVACRLFDAHEATPEEAAEAKHAAPGEAVARRGPALLMRCAEGALWIGHVRLVQGPDAQTPPLKLAATRALPVLATRLPEWPLPLQRPAGAYDELRYEEHGPEGARVGWLHFPFHNGAVSTRQCQRLLQALHELQRRPTQVLVLAGGPGFFSNGIHLHDIEAAAFDPGDSAAEASWRNINAIDDVALALITDTGRLTVAAMQGNAGAGGCFLALACDEVWAHGGVVLNPHYKNMGNLYGSEYWTYLLPRRCGAEAAARITQGRLPMGAAEARELGLVDQVLSTGASGFVSAAENRALAMAVDPGLPQRLQAKARRRAADEAQRPLAAYREHELTEMRRNFFGFDPSYHVARHHFVHRKPEARTPRHLALHRTGARP
jgi:putative two-component system protein, hydrogenase maturation factor HypX/HoxX